MTIETGLILLFFIQTIMFIICNLRISKALNLIMRLDQAVVDIDKQRTQANDRRYIKNRSLLESNDTSR